MKPICVPCQRFFQPERNGVNVLEQMPDGNTPKAAPGTSEAGRWSPYKLWMGDLWKCPSCATTIVCGVGIKPISEHFQPKFTKELELADDLVTVNDC